MKRDDVIAAPIVAGVVGAFTFFILSSVLAGMSGEILGMRISKFIAIFGSVIVAAALFGELLAGALEKK